MGTDLQPGMHLGRCELLCVLATGGMGSVWLARHHGSRGFDKLVAVKTISSRYAHDPHFQLMLLDEARISSRIEHPNVAMVLDFGEALDTTYLVMEWVPGEPLSRIHAHHKVKGTLLPQAVALRVLADACAGLHAAHELVGEDRKELSVVHRDVSPHNVLVGSNGTTKLVDFGIAKARDRSAGDTNTGQTKGKIRFMSPEQASGRTIDRRTDIWSVGVVLYLLFEDAYPYDAENDLAVLFKLTTGERAREMRRTPREVAAIVERCLMPSPEDRFPTARELRRAIEDAAVRVGATATADDVAAYLATEMEAALRERTERIERALGAAAGRARDGALLTRPVWTAPGQLVGTPTASPTPAPFSEAPTIPDAEPPPASQATTRAEWRPTNRPWRSLMIGFVSTVALLLVVAAQFGAFARSANVPSFAPVPTTPPAEAAVPSVALPAAPSDSALRDDDGQSAVTPAAALNSSGSPGHPRSQAPVLGPKRSAPSASRPIPMPPAAASAPPSYKSVTDTPL